MARPGCASCSTLALRIAGRVRFELELIELAPGDVLERDGYKIAPVPVAHRGPAFGYVLYEDERPGEFDPDAADRAGRRPRARVRAPAARRDDPRRDARAGDGPEPGPAASS